MMRREITNWIAYDSFTRRRDSEVCWTTCCKFRQIYKYLKKVILAQMKTQKNFFILKLLQFIFRMMTSPTKKMCRGVNKCARKRERVREKRRQKKWRERFDVFQTYNILLTRRGKYLNFNFFFFFLIINCVIELC